MPAGWNLVEVEWEARAVTGHLVVRLNRAPGLGFVGLSGLTNGTLRIETVRLGAVAGVDSVVSGWLYLDEYASFRTLAP